MTGTIEVCYAAALPFGVWAIMLWLGINADETRVPFLVCEAIAIAVSIHGLREKYKHDSRG